MAVLRHPLPRLKLGVEQPNPTTFDERYGNRRLGHHALRLLTHDLPQLLPLLWAPAARMWYARILDVVGRVALVTGLILAAAFPPWRVTYTFATNNKEARYQCREYVGLGPIVGGKDAMNARTLQPSGEFRLQSKAPWASFPNRIHCDSYTGKKVGISPGRWLMHFAVVVAGFGLLRRANGYLRESGPSALHERAAGNR